MPRGLSEISSAQPFPLPCRARVTPIFTGLPQVLFQVQEQGEGAGLGHVTGNSSLPRGSHISAVCQHFEVQLLFWVNNYFTNCVFQLEGCVWFFFFLI